MADNQFGDFNVNGNLTINNNRLLVTPMLAYGISYCAVNGGTNTAGQRFKWSDSTLFKSKSTSYTNFDSGTISSTSGVLYVYNLSKIKYIRCIVCISGYFTVANNELYINFFPEDLPSGITTLTQKGIMKKADQNRTGSVEIEFWFQVNSTSTNTQFKIDPTIEVYNGRTMQCSGNNQRSYTYIEVFGDTIS